MELDKEEIFNERFNKEDEIARGHFGVVFKVKEIKKKAYRAAKFIKCIRKREIDKVMEEINIMKSLKHDNLMELVGAFKSQKSIILVMELITGGELFDRVVSDDVDLTERDCQDFMSEICAGVHYLHSLNIAHLDLKPENILCISKESRKIKLIDFGLAKRLSPDLPVRLMNGTRDYIAPEVVNYDPVSTATDMWAVGVIVYILLSGLSPFGGDTDQDTYTNISKVKYDFDDEAFDDISTEAKMFIQRLLLKDQRHRMKSSECLSHPWLKERESSSSVIIKKDNLRSYNIKRKWQKTGNALRAIGRLSDIHKSKNVNLSAEDYVNNNNNNNDNNDEIVSGMENTIKQDL